MKSELFPVCVASIYLLVYTLLAISTVNIPIVYFLFCFSPVVVIWMVVRVLKADVGHIKALKEDEHWGYQDVHKTEYTQTNSVD
jgi:hypothetical protein